MGVILMVAGGVAVGPGGGGHFIIREIPLKFGSNSVAQLEEKKGV